MSWRFVGKLLKITNYLIVAAFFTSFYIVDGRASDNPLASVEDVQPNSLSEEFEKKGFLLGAPVFLRVYKQSSEIELWVQKGQRFALFKTYAICRWSGELGPKLVEGDKQSPEGVYHISASGLIVNKRWHRAMRLNYPNAFDIVNGRTGSGILIHGKCSSVGCFAITDGNVEEVYEAVEAALRSGQAQIPVLSLPFRFTTEIPSDADYAGVGPFWKELRQADLLFDRDRLPPSAWLCDEHYYFADRRGDKKRHSIPLRGCQPLDKPVDMTAMQHWKLPSILAGAKGRSPKEIAENAAHSCNPKELRCRMLRLAIASNATCPKKYPRCRQAYAAFTKSIECPLKYPRCRWFVGPDPKRPIPMQASVTTKGRRAKH